MLCSGSGCLGSQILVKYWGEAENFVKHMCQLCMILHFLDALFTGHVQLMCSVGACTTSVWTRGAFSIALQHGRMPVILKKVYHQMTEPQYVVVTVNGSV